MRDTCVRGLVYVKRDMSNEEAPKTFPKEKGNALSEWTKWAHAALHLPDDQPLPPPPASTPKGLPTKIKCSARNAFLASLNTCGRHGLPRHMEVISTLAPALGWPWEGADGSAYPAPVNSWLRAGMEQMENHTSGWIEWAAASMCLLSDKRAAVAFLPQKTVVEPWGDNEWGDWAYAALDAWWQSSALRFSARKHLSALDQAAFQRMTVLVREIDHRLHANPSPTGLPLHWQVAARQAQCCLLVPPAAELVDLGPLPPIHSEITIGPKSTRAWMGAAEWALARFTRQVNELRRWPEDRWDNVRRVMEDDIRLRGEASMSLMGPFKEGLDKAIDRIQCVSSAGRKERDERAIAACRVEVEAWWIDMATPQVSTSTPSRSRRL